MSPICLLLILLHASLNLKAVVVVGAKTKAPIANPGCRDNCGNVDIPYPFGIGHNCFLDPWFEIDCRETARNHSRKPFLSKLKIELMGVTFDSPYELATGFVTVRIPPLNVCSVDQQILHQLRGIDLRGSPYNFSIQENVFIMEGCSASAVLRNESKEIMGGCGTVCHNDTVIPTSSCIGVQCCQSLLSTGFYRYSVSPLQFYQIDFYRQQVSGEGQYCLVGAIIDSDFVNQYAGNLLSSNPRSAPPVRLVWNLPNDFQKSHNNPHATCYSDENFVYCGCDDNFKGNPYVSNGCQALEGCGNCRGLCQPQMDASGNPTSDKFYCENSPLLNLAAILGLSISLGMFFLAASVYGLYRFVKRIRDIKRRAKFFKRNGGFLMQQQLSSNKGVVERTKIFTASELDKATNHFNENRILGRGGQGTVYKGMLTDGSIVAVKKSKWLEESQLEQFINEVVILSRVNHRHVVKLFGCCLETEVPLLVYEYIPNGTLFQHIHSPDEDFTISWEMRLKIAADSACAVAYLHSSSSCPIYHRDIKSSNILLDEKHKAKVSDFGSSKTLAMDQTHTTTLIQGTMGYLDPEYFQTYQFTGKSDVYSFGVVLLELLTSKKPIYRDASTMEQKNLVTEFMFLTQSSRLSEILDPKIVTEAKEDELISFVELTKRCISWSGNLRPTMKEVAMILQMIIKSPAQVSTWYQQQEAFPMQYAAYDEFDMSGISDAEFMSTTIPAGAASPPYSDARALLPDAI